MSNQDRESLLKRIGERIRQARLVKRISQEELAIRISVGQDTISAYENGRRAMKVTELVAVANALDVTVDYLLKSEFYQPPHRFGSYFEWEVDDLVRALDLNAASTGIIGVIKMYWHAIQAPAVANFFRIQLNVIIVSAAAIRYFIHLVQNSPINHFEKLTYFEPEKILRYLDELTDLHYKYWSDDLFSVDSDLQ